MAKTSEMLLQDILNLTIPATVRISPQGQYVVYNTRSKWNHRKTEPQIACIWIAETEVQGSARPFTHGECFDWMPEWSPDGLSIAFLSNRGDSVGSDGKQKKTCAIYLQDLDGTTPRALMPLDSYTSISKISFSPNGKCIAFLAPEKKEERKKQDEDNDVIVWGRNSTLQNLWILDTESGELQVPFDNQAHVDDFVWCDGSEELVLMTHRSPHGDSKYLHGTNVSILRVTDRQLRLLCHVPRVVWSPVWLGSNLYFLANNIPDQDTSGFAVYRVQSDVHNQQQGPEKVANGEVDCATGLVRAGNDILVHVEHGVEDRLRLLLSDKTLVAQKKRILGYDASCTSDGHPHIVLSWGDVNRPTELFSINMDSGDSIQLSDHGHALSGTTFGRCHFLECPTLDGKEMLDSLYLVPAQFSGAAGDGEGTSSSTRSLPTLVILHGGPYARNTDAFDTFNPFYLLIQVLLTEGYGVFVPNYRGGSSRGERFASYARGGMGTYDEPDIVASVQHAIHCGFADPERLVLGGYSQGGYLAYLSAVRNGSHGFGWRYRGIIAVAGITDWDSMALTSDVGAAYESQFTGGAPWMMDKADTRTRSGSALWEFKAVAKHGRIPPMLMLHGEKDNRVHISQAWGFQRALEAYDLPFEFVTYPREGHYFRGRKHVEDLAKRILQFTRCHLT
ncbi:Peptidase S9, prolyl oligopeptidase, catalytic domain protein [Niveomyces insectorum RCEF 264]|uniref:Dipeptidyl-peptidase V n=1 Tax=Niveomyces insectorum RCEF 264 TaxID=1081102 RepID=A0A167W8E8_9HYPO|nr:Peptidase S9, prolyl oligopeptidase, catalytic domain protein [Niveomyces insectorum RCEF 264]